MPASTSDSSTVLPSDLPNTTKLAPDDSPFGSAYFAPMIRSASPSPFTSPAEVADHPEYSPAEAPLITKPPVPILIAESSTGAPSVFPRITKLAPELSPFEATTIRSSSPSPSTSPAELTELPEMSSAETPFITKPPIPASMADSSTLLPSVLPKTTKLAPEADPLGSSRGPPTIRSSSPPPFTPPAELTERAESSDAAAPLITKPPAPDTTADSSTALPSVLPKTT